MRILDATDTAALERFLARRTSRQAAVTRTVRRLVEGVRRGGDAALRRQAERLDGLPRGATLMLDRPALDRAGRGISRPLKAAIRAAARNIERVAARDFPPSRQVTVARGTTVLLRRTALDRVGCYVPGGRAPLVSSVLMTAVPARVAGVREVVVACPRPTPPILFAARLAGVSRILCAGGAHAIAALAYGTETVAAVDKIVGPGNAYVSAAKALVARDCAIDFYAGPTELVVVSDRGRAEWIARDLVAQAEHDREARAMLLTTSRALARAVSRDVTRLAPRFGPAAQAIARGGAIVVTRTLGAAIELANRLAPEHLACDDERVAARVRHAGTIFLGAYSAPALGDYATGSNHVLPTAGAARARGGLSPADFIKTTTIQRITRAGLRGLAPVATELARAESLEAHAQSIEVRL